MCQASRTRVEAVAAVDSTAAATVDAALVAEILYWQSYFRARVGQLSAGWAAEVFIRKMAKEAFLKEI